MATDAQPARLPKPGDPEVLYVLDLSGYVFRAYHALPPLSTSKGEPSHAVLGVTQMILKLHKEQKPVKLVVALDAPGKSARKEIFAGYKANRPPPPEDLAQQMKRLRQIVDAYELAVLEKPGVEADDLIAALVKRARAAGYRVVICAADKDLLQLVDDDVIMYDTMRERVYGTIEAAAKMGVPPHQIRDLLALMGDSSDNVPGVPKVGAKTAKMLLETYGDLDGIYAHLSEITRKALKKTLTEHKDEAYLSQKLVTLQDDVDLPMDLDAFDWTGGDQGELRELFTEMEFTRLLNELDPATIPKAAETYHLVQDEARLAEVAASIRQVGAVATFFAIDFDSPHDGELVGVGLVCGEEEGFYVPIGHRYLGAPAQLGVDEALEILGPIYEDPAIDKRSSDLKRDEILLRRHGVTLRGGRFDSTIASYLLDAGKHNHDLEEVARSELQLSVMSYDQATGRQRGKLKSLTEVEVGQGRDYAARRAAVTWSAHEALSPRLERDGFLSLMTDVELPLAHVLADMESTGMRIDVPYLRQMSAEVGAQVRQLEARCVELAGKDFNVGSPRQLETILFDELGLPVVKRTKTARSTDHEVLEELAAQHPLPEVILEHRQLSKLKSTYLDALPKVVRKDTGRVHTVYNQAVAATGRLSSSDPNLQNIPIRTEIGRRIREAFVPEEGFQILSADYSQIELRVLAHLAEDPELVDAFRKHEDVHVRTATALFDVAPAEVTREQRGQAKTVNYAVIYGQSHFALARNLRIERREAMRYIEAFFARYAGVKKFMDETIEEARRTGGTRTLLGRRRMLADLNSRNRNLRNAAERVARNTPIQGTAADIIKLAMVRIHRTLEERQMASKMLLTVHDELVFEAPEDEKSALEELVVDAMQNALSLSVPLVVDHGWGATWGQAH